MGSATAAVSHAALAAVPQLETCQSQCVSMQHDLCQKRKRSASIVSMATQDDQPPQPLIRSALQPMGPQQQQQQPQQSTIISKTTTKQLLNPVEKLLSEPVKVAVKAGTGVVQASRMTDSTPEHAARNWTFLRQRLQQEGYLMIRNVLSSPQVMKVLPLSLSLCSP